MKKILRYIIAIIFIASGFVKAIDVVGFSFKLDEYFAADVFNMPLLQKYSLEIAVFVVVLELVLGFMLLLKIQLKKTLIALILLCIFFAFLTFYSAYFNKVTDCGCFGDAVKFTPWQSFTKDMALLAGLLVLWFLYRKSFQSNQKAGAIKKVLLTLFILISACIIAHGIRHEPLIDFRDYKIGTDLNAERQKVLANPSEYKVSYTLKNSITGEEKVVGQDDYVNHEEYWSENTPWTILEGKNVSTLVKEGYSSEIAKFRLEDLTGNDLTDQILHLPKVYLIFSYHPDEISPITPNSIQEVIKKVGKQAKVYGVSTRQNIFPGIENLMMDGTAIKTIARSNPFILILENGKIVRKESLKDFLND